MLDTDLLRNVYLSIVYQDLEMNLYETPLHGYPNVVAKAHELTVTENDQIQDEWLYK